MADPMQPPPLQPAQPAKRVKAARPAIGMAICFCVLVASALAGLVVLCGPGGVASNQGSGSNAQQVVGWLFLWLIGVSAVGLVVCFLWLIVALIRGGGRD